MGLARRARRCMARHNVERATGKPSICSNPRRILSYDTPQITGTRRRRAAWARNAPCPPRTPSKSAADAGHGHADHTPGSGHDPLRTSRSLGGMSTWYRSMLPSAPTLPPHGHCSGHGASKVLSGTGIARTVPPVDPGLRPGFFGSRFGLSLDKGAAWRLPARRDSSSTLSSLAIRASRSFNYS